MLIIYNNKKTISCLITFKPSPVVKCFIKSILCKTAVFYYLIFNDNLYLKLPNFYIKTIYFFRIFYSWPILPSSGQYFDPSS